MASTLTPSWTDNTAVIAAGTVAKGSVASGTLDLRAKFGAFLSLKIGRGGTTALGTAITIWVRRLLNNGAAAQGGPYAVHNQLQSSTTATNGNTTVNVDSASGQNVLNVASVTNFAAGDDICIQDSGGGVTRLEFAKVSKVSGSTLVLDRNLIYSHTAAQADTVRNKADQFNAVWLPGGSSYEVVIDYGAAATGDTATFAAIAQTYDSDSAT